MRFLAFPGSSPALSSAEAIAQLPAAGWRKVGPIFGADDLPANALDTLAGCTKIATVLFSTPTETLAAGQLADWVEANPRGSGKLVFGLTWLGSSFKRRRFALELKEALKRLGRSVRWFEGEGGVSPAAVAQVGLINDGYDFTVVEDGPTAWVAVTHAVQNADRWTELDMGRPRRNAKNGMTPPKLASLLVHLAGTPASLLDPFCGSGTLLSAAGMAGVGQVFGSDISADLIEDARENLAWTEDRGLLPGTADIQLAVADATEPLPLPAGSIASIVTEGYLGHPLRGQEPVSLLEGEARDVQQLWERALPHLREALADDGILIATWPSYRTSQGQARVDLPTMRLEKLGFSREPFALIGGANVPDLLYVRPEQFVGRRIVKLRKA